MATIVKPRLPCHCPRAPLSSEAHHLDFRCAPQSVKRQADNGGHKGGDEGGGTGGDSIQIVGLARNKCLQLLYLHLEGS